ncbi:MAG: site-specific DNA-methyltransferase [Candidatus Binataceae bacterium]|nr:site-specific DNA-methyltransferase [Candidatus Binataceae bacterium]
MSEKFDKLKNLLKELFQLDQPDLDFGLYRIMHAKAAEVTQFLDEDLLPQVKEAFSQYRTADKVELEKELAKVITGVEAAGLNPDDSPKVKELRDRIKGEAVDVDALENEVYDQLFSFFRRYYSEGDFLAKRVYKSGVYAIPYEGEEVKLHWANRDQYYIKSGEYLRDYAFRLRPENEQKAMRVHFRLLDAAEGEHGNVKPANGNDRVFILAAEAFIAEEKGELVMSFEYRPATVTDWPEDAREGKTKPPTQKEMTALAVKRVLEMTDAAFAPWIVELGKPHLTTAGERADYSRLEGHLRRYTARNTFDYFIHKDLGRFLRRELDFYVKNEVMHLDDVENETAPRVEQYLSRIKVIRRIAGKIIDFLAQLEDFEKKLWLKKKFVVETNYCITLDRIPEECYAEIAANNAQREEWVRLLAIDEIKGDLTIPAYSEPLSVKFLKAQPTLVLDTRHFAPDFVARLLDAIGDLDEQTDGLLIQSENFQALSLMRARYQKQIKCVYIDPPYNTDAGPIDYKNGYRSSSWMSLIANRLGTARQFLSDDGVLCVTIDDYQVHELATLLDQEFGRDHHLGTAVIRNNPSGRSTVRGLSVCHEYAFFYTNGDSSLERLPRTEKQLERFTEEDGGYVDWRNFRKDGGAVTHRAERPKQYYPIYVRLTDRTLRIPALSWNRAEKAWDVLEDPVGEEVVVWPIDEKGQQRVWSLNHISALENISNLEVRVTKDGSPQVYRRHRPSEGILPRSWWDKNTYAAREYGSAALTQLFGSAPFSFAKSPFAVQDCLWVSGLAGESDREVLDYFAGSGTTGHAVINLNRQDGGQRKFILVEMGDYFDTVLLPRIKKVTFTPEWKDGKPKRQASKEEAERSPRIVKVIRLESYEDALNNLQTHRTPTQQLLLEGAEAQNADGLKEQYLLRYMLDVETRGSQSLLNIPAFRDPTAYKLKVKRPSSDESREVNVDLLATFNYLIGLTVQNIAAPQNFTAEFERDSEKRLYVKGRLKQVAAGPWWFRTVSGAMPDGRRTLVIWRKLTGDPEKDNLVLDEWFTKQGYSTKDYEFQLIYVNGDSNLENLKAPDDTWKVRLIEEDLHGLMFDTEVV